MREIVVLLHADLAGWATTQGFHGKEGMLLAVAHSWASASLSLFAVGNASRVSLFVGAREEPAETMPAGGCLFVIVGTDDKPIYQAEFPEARSQRVRRRRSGGSATQSC